VKDQQPLDAKQALNAVRSHWQVESVHWVLVWPVEKMNLEYVKTRSACVKSDGNGSDGIV